MGRIDTPSRGGRVKLSLAAAGLGLVVVGWAVTLPGAAHAGLATGVFALLVGYTVVAVARFGPAAWAVGAGTIVVAAYWWAGVLAQYHVPREPVLPYEAIPRGWAFWAMAAWVGADAAGDAAAAWAFRARDRRTALLATLVLLAGAGAAGFVSARGPQPLTRFTPDGPPQVRFEVRAASDKPRPGYTEAVDPGTGKPLYLAPDAAITNADVAAAAAELHVVPGDEFGPATLTVSIRFTRAAAGRFADLTRANLGGTLAILFDGKVKSAPVVRAVIPDGVVTISGGNDFDAERLAKGAAGRK